MARGGADLLSPVCAYVAARTGSSLSPQQVIRLREVFTQRLGGRTEDQFLIHLKSQAGAGDLADLMSSISVHKTDLFRDEPQLEAFRQHVLGPMARASTRPLHVWSAGCATGEEVATLLILLAEAGAHSHSTVLGTDIAESALRQAREQYFHAQTLRRVPHDLRDRYFRKARTGWELIPELKQRANFSRHNLMDRPYPVSPNGQGFDVIFCRNVLIYFTEAAFDAVVDALAQQLKPGGTLVLSAAEPILRRHPELVTLRCDNAFFYVRQGRGQVRVPGRPAPRTPPRGTGSAAGSAPAKPAFLFKTPPPPPPPVRVSKAAVEVAAPQELDPREEAEQIFELVLEWAAAGETEGQTEQGLRKCVYLDPHFAQARYLLGMMLEQRGARADAASEYRRALSALNEGKARQTAFFINDERLKTACEKALKRLGYPTNPEGIRTIN